MTNKELLELAAKAIGAQRTRKKEGNDFFQIHHLHEGYEDDWEYWDPLTCDGDALRLAVKLGIQVLPNYKSSSGKLMTWAGIGMQTIYEPHDEDAMEATRRAIVKAAALIGKELK